MKKEEKKALSNERRREGGGEDEEGGNKVSIELLGCWGCEIQLMRCEERQFVLRVMQ